MLAERTFRDTFAPDNTEADMDLHCATHFGQEHQLRELRDPGCVTLLAEDGVEAVGFAQLRLSQPVQCLECVAPAELQRIYLVATWQGRSLARQLMARVFAAAAAANAHCLWLGVWEHNPRALAFYAKLGFGTIGDHSFMLGTLMQRDLVMVAPVAAPPR